MDAETMAGWYYDVAGCDHSAALKYLTHGILRAEVLDRLEDRADKPPCLQDHRHVENLLEALDVPASAKDPLLIRLFPDRFTRVVPELIPSSDEDRATEVEAAFRRLQLWWSEGATRDVVIDQYEEAVWPAWLRQGGLAEGLRRNCRDHWLALLTLGACQSLGRTQDQQNRGFLDLVHRRGWWEVFANSEDDEAWMGVLRDWQDAATDHIEYRLWTSLFPSIYQFSRYLDEYRLLLTSAGRRPEHLYKVRYLLAPRVDEALSGAGAQFDAPPAPLGIGHHWVLRELVRLRVVDATYLHPHCYVPAKRVVDLLGPLGLDVGDGDSYADMSQTIHDLLEEHLEDPHFGLTFDIPLRHVAEHEGLRQTLDLDLRL